MPEISITIKRFIINQYRSCTIASATSSFTWQAALRKELTVIVNHSERLRNKMFDVRFGPLKSRAENCTLCAYKNIFAIAFLDAGTCAQIFHLVRQRIGTEWTFKFKRPVSLILIVFHCKALSHPFRSILPTMQVRAPV